MSQIDAGAIDPADTVTIPRSTIVSMFNAGGLSGQYLASNNTYQSFSWSLSNPDVKIVNDCVGVGNVGADSYAAWYQYQYTGWSPHVDSYGAQMQVPINLHFQNCSYISFNVYWGCVTGAYGANKQVGLSEGQQYNTLCVGQYSSDLVPVSARYTDNSVPAWSIATLLDGAPELGMMHVEIEQSTASDMYIGDLDVAWLNPTWRFDKIYFAITDIEINSGYTYVGRDAPPAYSSPVDPDWGSGTVHSSGTVSGTISDGSNTQNINVTVETETDNSGLVASLLNGIKRLFVPSDDSLQSFSDDLKAEAEEHLGGLAEAVTLIDEQADYLRAATSADYIYLPELTLPIGESSRSGHVSTLGADVTLIQGQQVELRPARTGKLKPLWDLLEFAIDAVCVLAVFNMMQTKYEIFLNPDGEVIDYDN